MAEAIALEKLACPACGAEGVWNPAKHAVVCPYCGVTSPFEKHETSGEIEEHDLVTALREIPSDKRGWKSEKTSVKCQSCQAITVFDPNRVAQRCDFCGSSQIVPYEQIKPPISPESVLPFQVDETRVRDSIRQWYRTRWFSPGRFKTTALTDTIKGIYLPYWTFDANVHANWTAESGYHYYTTESYRDSNGNIQTRQVQHTRWESSSGEIEHFFDDELVCASRGVHEELLHKIDGFPTKQLLPYSPSYIAGWVVEQYQLDLVGAAQQARNRMEREVESMCGSQVPGDTYRNLDVEASFSGQTFKHILVPIWFLTYTYGAKNYQVVVNGVTGEIAGKHPLSAWKIFFLVVSLLFGLLILFAILSSH